MDQKFPLSDVINYISSELLIAAGKSIQNHGGVAPLIFKECELEFAVEFKKEADASIKAWLMNVDGKTSKTDKNTIKIKFSANPDVLIQALSQNLGPGPIIPRKKSKTTLEP